MPDQKPVFEKEKAMNNTIQTKMTKAVVRFAALGAAAAALLLAADSQAFAEHEESHASHGRAPAKLVELVRNATRQFLNVNVATAATYQPFLGCVSGPEHGAMGVHYVNGALVNDGVIDASKPEALIYEPTPSGMLLVGVEYIVDAASWLQKHNNTPPVLEGQSFQLVNSPNRYGLPAFFELHVWAWRDNPNGAFVDWNTKVSCERQ
jgi:hypothetical protein